MSAINEWFGAYNMIFRHIRKNFGDGELDRYVEYLGNEAYADISCEFRDKGLDRVRERYVNNFIKDGGRADAVIDGGRLFIDIIDCPAYKYMFNSENPFDKPEPCFCNCCAKLNSRILSNAGYHLVVTGCDNRGRCRWELTASQVLSQVEK